MLHSDQLMIWGSSGRDPGTWTKGKGCWKKLKGNEEASGGRAVSVGQRVRQ